jgi:hypothetical protein
MNPNIKINDFNLNPLPVMTMTAPPENNIVLHAGETEMLRIAQDGFYVRGKKLETDDQESQKVYNCFKQWLEWSMLNKEY